MNKLKQQLHVLPQRLEQIKGLLNREQFLTMVEDLKTLVQVRLDHDFVIFSHTS